MMKRALSLLAVITLAGSIAIGVAAVPASAAGTCTIHLGGVCGPYDDPKIPMANGYNLYVDDQSIDPQNDSNTLTSNGPGSWSTVENDQPYGFTGVQDAPATMQQFNDWNGNGWGGNGASDTPLSALSSLQVKYSETSPSTSDPNSIYEFATDLWNDNYGDDVMMWADTSPIRCDENGLSGDNIIGQATIHGQNWTVYRYGGAGGEVVFILDGTTSTDPVDTDTCAQQTSGTLHILGAFKWLAGHKFMTNPGTMSLIQTGWEITSADNTTFSMNSYSIKASLKA